MKKKLFLITLVVALFVCLFAISVSAADMFDSDYTDTVTKFYDADGTTEIGPDWADLTDANATAVIKKADGTAVRIPLYYIYQTNGSTELRHEIRTGTGSAGFRYDWISTQLAETVNHANLVAFDIPEGIKTTSGLNNYTVLEEVVFPLTATGFPKSEKHPTLKKVFAKQVKNADGTISGITTVSDYAFKNVTTLEYFGMQLNYATYIGGNAFLNCAISEVNFEGPFTGMGGAAFSGCNSLTTVRFINTSSTIISCGKQAFANCSALTSVVMDKFSIGECAFEKIYSTTGTLDFVATNVERVETGAFSASTALCSVDIEGPLTSVASNVFGNCSNIAIIRIYNTASKAATCGDNLLSCGDKATDKPAITSVTLHNIDLGYRALYNLKNDGVKISVTGNYTSIGYQALAGAAITEFTIPASVTSLGQNAFSNCKALKSVVFENVGTEMSIGNDSFKSCSALETVKFNKNAGIKYLGVFMFYECKALEYLSIPDSVTTLKTSAFYNCDALGPVYLPKNLATIEKIDSLFEGCENMYFVNEFFEDPTKVEKPSVYYFPNIITEIPKDHEMFKLCANLNETIVFGDKLTAVNDGFAFGKYDSKAPTTNYVFLGNVTDFAYYGGYFYNTNLYFCNPNTTVESINIYVYNSSSNSTNCNVYICASGVWSDLKTRTFENTMAKTNHLQEKIVETPATCTLNEGTHKLCFCGFVMESTDKVDGEKALGHTSKDATVVMYFPLLNGAPNYFEDAHNKYNCSRCNEEQDEVAEGTALFVGDRGYSYEENGTSVLYRLHVNVENIKAYSGAFRYGIIVSGAPSTAPITLVDGAITYGAQTLVFEMQSANYEFDYIQAKVTNIGAAELNCQAYAIDNNVVTYIGHNNVNTLAEIVTYDAIFKAYGTTSGETKEN